MKKRFLSILLTLYMVLMLVPATVFAEETDIGNFNENSSSTDPVTGTIEKELQNIIVLNEEEENVSLTQEQRQKILEVWTQYQNHRIAHADFFGVQLPFFLGYNANNEDSLGILGEMLVLTGYTVNDVKNGNYKFDDLMEMIQTFYYADQFGLEFYGTVIPNKRDEAIKKVKESGASTMAQKILVLNDWIATLTTTENSQKNPYYDTIYARMYPIYEEQISSQLQNKIYEEVESSLRQQYYEGAIKTIIKQNSIGGGMSEEDAEAVAQNYMNDNAVAISNNVVEFIKGNFGPEAADQIKAGADGFINEAETEGIEMDPENNPGVKMTIDDIVEDQMDESRDDLGGMTPNQAISVYADQAATDLTQGIMDVWAGSHIGILAEGKGVCAGYSKTLAYLLQYMSPEYYGVNGADTDMSVSANWKTPKDLYYDEEDNFDVNQNYLVDMVRITLDAGASAFSEVHYRNAIKIDGKWYYVDSCNDETVKKDIPTFTIDAPDKVCRTQECEVSVILPDTITNAELTYEFKVLSGTIDTTIEDGKLHAVISADSYSVSENSFNLVIYATTDDNYLFKVSKNVQIQNEHAGGQASYFKKAVCKTCNEEYGSLLTDTTAPTGEITVGTNKWNSFLNTITFGFFFKDTQSVAITATDDSYSHAGYTDDKAVKVEYYLYSGDTALTQADLAGKEFTEYGSAFNINSDNKYVVYARLTDHAGNITYISSEGIVLDATVPVITGIENGKTYCEAQTVTVTEEYIESVKVNGTAVTLDANNQFVLNPAEGTQTIVVTDKAGNVSAEITVTVNDGHTYEWQEDNGQYWKKCQYCDDETVKKDIPTFTIDAPDMVCRTQDCEASFLLPENIANAELAFEFINLGGGLDVTIEDGRLHGVLPASGYPDIENDFNLVVYATTDDGFLFTVRKNVKIQNEHAGGVATCIELAICDTCGQPYGEVDSTNHNLEKVPAKFATVTETGNTEYWHCTDCGKYFADENGENEIELADTVIAKLPPEIIEGMGQSLTEGESKELTFRSNAAFSDYIRVEIDGKTLDEKDYTVKEGSTVVTLKADYVATLSVGEHKIGIVSESGTATTTFTVNAKAVEDAPQAEDDATNSTQSENNDTKSPQTGDNSHMALWIALLFVSGAGVIGTTVYGKKKRAK